MIFFSPSPHKKEKLLKRRRLLINKGGFKKYIYIGNTGHESEAVNFIREGVSNVMA